MAGLNVFLAFLYKRGLRLKEASRMTGVPLGTLANVSAGSRKLTPELRKRLAKGLGCKPSDIPCPNEDGEAA